MGAEAGSQTLEESRSGLSSPNPGTSSLHSAALQEGGEGIFEQDEGAGPWALSGRKQMGMLPLEKVELEQHLTESILKKIENSKQHEKTTQMCSLTQVQSK